MKPASDKKKIADDLMAAVRAKRAASTERARSNARTPVEKPAEEPIQFEYEDLAMGDSPTTDPRDWIIKGYVRRGEVHAVCAPPATVKSGLLMALAMSIATGEAFGDMPAPRVTGPVVVINNEDGPDENHRKADALQMMVFKTRPKPGQLLLLKPSRPIRLIEMTEGGGIRRTDAFTKLKRECIERGVVALVLDPLVEMHKGVVENDATMEEVHLAMRELGRDCNMAVIYAHHFNKGGVAESMMAGRGSSTMPAGARVQVNLARMSEQEAEQHLSPDDAANLQERWRFVKMIVVKNSGGPEGTVTWFEKKIVDLDPLARDGEDRTAVYLEVAPFSGEPEAFDPITWDGLPRFLDAIEAGLPGGKGRYTAAGKDGCRADALLARMARVPPRVATKAISDLEDLCVIKVGEYQLRDKDDKLRPRKGYVVVRRPGEEERDGRLL